MRQTEIFVILGYFLPFQPLTTWKIKTLKLKKNTLTYYHFTHLHHTCQSYDHMIYGPKIWNATDIIFCHSEPFFALLPPYGPRKPKF